MKFIIKHIKLIILFLTCTLIFFIYQKNDKNNINYISLGDGYAQGINSYGIKDYGYSDYIKDYLIKKEKLNIYSKDYTQKDMSIKMLYTYILTNQKKEKTNQKDNIRYMLREGELLTISVGLNDLLYQLSITDNLTETHIDIIIEDIEQSFKTLIKEIKKYYQYEIYVIGYYNIDSSNIPLTKAIEKLNNVYKKNSDITYISTYELFNNDLELRSNPNSIYPNATGYEKISDIIIKKISKSIEK